MNRLLIANRGEIALRILRACRELGIEVVVAYTQADKDSAYLSQADDAVCIGKRSYLDGQQILAAASSRHCDGIHPGYGFLAEDADFAARVEAEGLVFVGPTAEHIGLMGNKAGARRVMSEAGVAVLPGSLEALAGLGDALAQAGQIGYPVMLKASHGGGGRGIAIVHDEAGLRDAYGTISARADMLFRNDALYLEKFLKSPRHIELQVFGDGKGKVIFLGARDCSIQRHHQKLLEEAPPVGISEKYIRDLAGKVCKTLAAMAYRNAGTCEFLYRDGAGHFIEMNTRIQVEHPVTEAITGLDLVKLQLNCAARGSLDIEEADIQQRGHAIECRINAEDAHFKPSPGVVGRLTLADGMGIRTDTHLYAGYRVPHDYDTLLAKVIAWGIDREEAIMRMKRALNEMEISGPNTNIELHKRILANDKFVAGEYTTGFIDEAG